MKKIVALLLLCTFTLTVAACGDDGAAAGRGGSQSATVEDIMENGGKEEAKASSSTSAAAGKSDGAYDIDLTALSSTMVYSEVFDMVNEPDKYIGKSVKMAGTMNVYEGENQNYFACIIADATACCAQGIEFVWKGDHTYPDDYPPLDAPITVTGIFDTYMEDDQLYCRLIDAELTF